MLFPKHKYAVPEDYLGSESAVGEAILPTITRRIAVIPPDSTSPLRNQQAVTDPVNWIGNGQARDIWQRFLAAVRLGLQRGDDDAIKAFRCIELAWTETPGRNLQLLRMELLIAVRHDPSILPVDTALLLGAWLQELQDFLNEWKVHVEEREKGSNSSCPEHNPSHRANLGSGSRGGSSLSIVSTAERSTAKTSFVQGHDASHASEIRNSGGLVGEIRRALHTYIYWPVLFAFSIGPSFMLYITAWILKKFVKDEDVIPGKLEAIGLLLTVLGAVYISILPFLKGTLKAPHSIKWVFGIIVIGGIGVAIANIVLTCEGRLIIASLMGNLIGPFFNIPIAIIAWNYPDPEEIDLEDRLAASAPRRHRHVRKMVRQAIRRHRAEGKSVDVQMRHMAAEEHPDGSNHEQDAGPANDLYVGGGDGARRDP